jgi:hypothetical protein
LAGNVSFAKVKATTVIIVGHIEDGSFVAEVSGRAGEVAYRIPIVQLEEAAQKAGVTVLSVGCKSFLQGARTGYLEAVTDFEVAESIKNALRASTYSEWLSAFGRADTPFVVTEKSLTTLVDGRVLDLARLERHTGKVSVASTSLRLFARRAAETAAGEDAVAMLGGFLIIGALGFVFLFPWNRRTFLRLFPKIPSGKFSPITSAALKTFRELLFVIVGIPISTIVAFSIVFGLWSKREKTYELLWTAIFSPILFVKRVTSLVVDFTIGLIMKLGTLIAFVIPAFTLLMDIVNKPSSYTTLSLWLFGLLLIPYSYAGWWMLSRFPTRFGMWLGRRNISGALLRTALLIGSAAVVSVLIVVNGTASVILQKIATVPFNEVDWLAMVRELAQLS